LQVSKKVQLATFEEPWLCIWRKRQHEQLGLPPR